MFRSHLDDIVVAVLRGCALIAGVIVLLVLAFLLRESVPALRSIGTGFFSDRGWFPNASADAGSFNLGSMLIGTIAATLGAVVIATPFGVLSAVFCRFYAPRPVAGAYRRIVELFAGIPSVVYGFWGLTTLAPLIRQIEPPGTSLITGILVLGIMILPTIALLSEAAMRNVPETYVRAAAALALPRWAMVRRVVIPAARNGIGVAVLLGTARAIGETMAVLMVCGNIARTPHSLFDPVRTLTANIALELGYAAGDHRSALFVSGLVLMGMILVLVLGTAVLSRESHRA